MKKVLLVLIIITLTLLAGVSIFLGLTVFKNKDEISNLKKQAEAHEQENGEYQNKIDNMEKQISELDQLWTKYSEQNKSEENKTAENNATNNEDETADYEIVEKLPKEIEFDKNTQGTEIVEYQGNYYVIIKMGTRPSTGYSISVTKVEINGTNTDIYVKKTYPSFGSVQGQMLTNPYVAVKFDFKPNVNIVD